MRMHAELLSKVTSCHMEGPQSLSSSSYAARSCTCTACNSSKYFVCFLAARIIFSLYFAACRLSVCNRLSRLARTVAADGDGVDGVDGVGRGNDGVRGGDVV